jgi:hypothetical protein
LSTSIETAADHKIKILLLDNDGVIEIVVEENVVLPEEVLTELNCPPSTTCKIFPTPVKPARLDEVVRTVPLFVGSVSV